jgi:dolichyl-phosphate-mannose--protein O-mannosyl transferase
MSSNIDFKALWQQQPVSQPDMKDLMTRLHRFKQSNIRRLIKTNVLLIATSLFIGFVWYYYQPQFITTKMGIVITILAMVIFLFVYNKMFSLFNKIDDTSDNNHYLQNLIVIKGRQRFLQHTMMNVYFGMLSAGMCLYMYEYTSRMTMTGGIITYAVTFTWIAFNWFYLRPKTIKKQQAKLDDLITKFEGINQQLNT